MIFFELVTFSHCERGSLRVQAMRTECTWAVKQVCSTFDISLHTWNIYSKEFRVKLTKWKQKNEYNFIKFSNEKLAIEMSDVETPMIGTANEHKNLNQYLILR